MSNTKESVNHIHFLGICGTFMGSIALLAQKQGFKVTGADQNTYPPMSDFLKKQDIEIINGYGKSQLTLNPDLIVIGNTVKRGQPVVEALLNQRLPYTSGPKWLYEYILKDKYVLCVTGTHGKTSTTSMLAKILEHAGLNPGFLIGGISQDFQVPARLTSSPYFVIEGDEYDTAYFDKRAKFLHYQPQTTIINNIEYDHADIFDDLKAIQTQFHHLIRTLPQNTHLIYPANAPEIAEVIDWGLWPQASTFKSAYQKKPWHYHFNNEDGTRFSFYDSKAHTHYVQWSKIGEHNVQNAISAIIASTTVGVSPQSACQALSAFKGAKRRLEKIADINNIALYDDFAHHPTAMQVTLEALRRHVGHDPIHVIFEPRCNTMKMGYHQNKLADALKQADRIFIYEPPGLNWRIQSVCEQSESVCHIHHDIDQMAMMINQYAHPGTHLLIMSNGGFGGLHQKLYHLLQNRSSAF